LIVEDEGIEALDLQHRLASLGYTAPDIVSNGVEAVIKAEQTQPDLIMMDIMMPGEIDGVTAAGRIRARFDIPVIFLTAYADEDTLQRAKATGPYGYLVKPFKERDLHLSIDLALYKHKTEKKLKESEERFRLLVEGVKDYAIFMLDPAGNVMSWNSGAERINGYREEEIVGKQFSVFYPAEDAGQGKPQQDLQQAVESGRFEDEGWRVRKDGSRFWANAVLTALRDDNGGLRGFSKSTRDITGQKLAQKERETTIAFLRMVNDSTGTRDLVQAAATFFQQQSGCEAVGIRLHEGEDYPYYEARGFPTEFVLMENSLCAKDDAGCIIRDSTGNPVIECMCGNVICGRSDPAKPFFTEHGSFWTNNTTELLRTTTEADRQARTRNRCNGEGYESVALLPLRLGEQRLGLVQLNDRRIGVFSAEVIASWERLADHLAVALAKFRAEEELRKSEQRYRSLFDNMIEGFAHCKLVLVHGKAQDFVYLAVNGAFETLTGLRDVVGKKVSEVIPGIQETNPELFEIYGRVALTGTPERFEAFSDAFGGWLSISVYSTEKEHFVAVFDNITERKLAEEKLRESEALLRTVVQTIPDLIWLKDADGVYLSCNPMFERFFGAKEADIVGKTDYNFVSKELADFFRDHDRKAMEAGKPSSNEEWITFADDGHRALLDTIKTPMYDARGNLIGVLGIARDITERKQAEEALATSEGQVRKLYQEFHGLLDAVPDSLMLLDKDLKVLWANRVAAESIGGTPEALTGRHCHSLWYERATPCDPCPVLKSFSTGRPLSETVTRPDGRIFDIRTVPLRDEGGSIARVIEVVREVTEHSRLEAQYLQAQKMESIGTLAGGVAHDFNNILSAIIGYGHVTLMKMAGDDPLRSNIEHILEASDRAARLTKELLLFSRKHVSERKPVDVNEVVSMVEKFLRMVIGEDIACRTMLQERSLPVYADSHQLEQVLMNLATNARDAMPGGGAFTVKTEQVNLTEDFISAHGYGISGTYAMITISDTGIGMDEATRNRIFEPFYTTKEVGKGTGLGLAVVYGIIKQHDGFINVYSEPGKGTTFRIYLPIIGALVTEETKAQHNEAPARGTETVLVAEDDENLRKLSRTVLAEFGYTVIEAVDGEDAVKKFMEHKDTIQLLLFDLIMPKMNGKEASDEIRKIKPEMKVLFASGYDPDLLQQKALLEDGVHLVYKPISPMDLLRKVRSVLDGVIQ
jgi:PAS domain S-box-containing protein